MFSQLIFMPFTFYLFSCVSFLSFPHFSQLLCICLFFSFLFCLFLKCMPVCVVLSLCVYLFLLQIFMSPFLLPSTFSFLQVSISLHIACFRLSTIFFSLCVFEHLFCLLVFLLLSLCICLCRLGFIYICHHLFFCVSILVSSRFLSQRMSFVPSPFIVCYTLTCLPSFFVFLHLLLLLS